MLNWHASIYGPAGGVVSSIPGWVIYFVKWYLMLPCFVHSINRLDQGNMVVYKYQMAAIWHSSMAVPYHLQVGIITI